MQPTVDFENPTVSRSTPRSRTPIYLGLERLWSQVYRFNHLLRVAGWDQRVNMPPKGQHARDAAMTELTGHVHRLLTASDLSSKLERAEQEPLTDDQRSNLREIRRVWLQANALPVEFVERQSLVNSRSEHAWRTQRRLNDWNGHLVHLREVVELAREEARLRSDQMGCGLYESLLSNYEPGATTAQIDRIFASVRSWLPDLIDQVLVKQAKEKVLTPVGPFDIAAQKTLCEAVMRLLGFDLEAGRLDVADHPFCGGVADDVRLTTRFSTSDFTKSLLATIHETGHGRYEQGLPKAWIEQPVGESRSMAIHESQSLSFEMQIAAHPGFVEVLSDLITDAFGAQDAFHPENLKRLMTRVKPGLIRVDADEVTYPGHVVLRYEIEKPLIEGLIQVEDIPELWDAKMFEFFGLETKGNFCDGPMQDVHWPVGLFGYFPCYSLGAMYSAQWFAAMSREHPDLESKRLKGDNQPLFDWLSKNIWQRASFHSTDDLARMASGETLNPEHFKRHLESRYLGTQSLAI